MNRNLLISIIVIVLLLLGVGFYLMRNQGSQNPVQQAVEQAAQNASRGTIQSLIGKNQMCKVSYPDGNGSGTVYVSGDKVRGDFNIQAESQTMNTHMIQGGQEIYMWNDGSNQGTKIKIDPNQPTPSAPAGQPQTADLNQEVDYSCNNWSPDESKFRVPTDVQFMDMSQMMQKPGGTGPMPTGTGTPKIDPSICNQIPDAAAKAECLKSLEQ